jgi:hypothetical protein
MSAVMRHSIFVAVTLSSLASQSAYADFDFVHGGHSYVVVEQRRNWAAAAADAATRQLFGVSGYLAIIESAGENQAIFTQLANPANIPPAEYSNTQAPDGGNGIYVWIAGTDRVTEGRWIWDGDGDNVGEHFYQGEGRFGGSAVSGHYHNWGRFSGAPWEPDNAQNGPQDAAGIGILNWPRGNAGEWNDVRADNTLYYVVEFNAVPEPQSLVLAAVGCFVIGVSVLRARGRRRSELRSSRKSSSGTSNTG